MPSLAPSPKPVLNNTAKQVLLTHIFILLPTQSYVWLFVTLWAPPGSSVHGISYSSGSPFPSPGNLPAQGANSCFRCLLHWQGTEPPEKSSRNCSRADIVQWLYRCPIASNSKSASYIVDAHLILMRKEDCYGAEKERYRLWIWAECRTRGSPPLKQWMTNSIQ